MFPQFQYLTVLASHTHPSTNGSYGGDDVLGTEESHHLPAFWDEQQVVLEGDTVLAHLVFQRTVLGKGKTPSVELFLLCAGGDIPYPHRSVFGVGDQCLRIHVLDLRNRLPEKFFLVSSGPQS